MLYIHENHKNLISLRHLYDLQWRRIRIAIRHPHHQPSAIGHFRNACDQDAADGREWKG